MSIDFASLPLRTLARGLCKGMQALRSDGAPRTPLQQEAHPDLYLLTLSFSWPRTFPTLSADPTAQPPLCKPSSPPCLLLQGAAAVSCVSSAHRNPESAPCVPSGAEDVRMKPSPALPRNMAPLPFALYYITVQDAVALGNGTNTAAVRLTG